MPTIELVECSRDAMQGWPRIIDTAEKIAYLNSLLKVGFDVLDFGSFVSPKAVPQMADTEAVLQGLDLAGSRTKLLAIVANLRGASAAAEFEHITYLGFPFSISPTFQLRNTNSSIGKSVTTIEEIQELCVKNNKTLVVYLSMGFGNPYGDPYNEEILFKWADEMVARDVEFISLADTVGLAMPDQITGALNALLPAYKHVKFSVHLHSRMDNRATKIDAAIAAGCTRFEGALKGIGGCPFAQDELVGNIDTAYLIRLFEEKQMLGSINHTALNTSLEMAEKIFSGF
ncbi:hydroxymethylglutaryl-CoA lyase [Danxiaibacter flavus]|uniref:Hydroxymethylglutaryl-CoA lyase n=1 Tax=Danxiaibacter flavus TaxID=3049108 RepID=A0ABV3ZC56_9BACT|nr:hydroxymethylglutaryl-CoA lyase [Chitinophagaceae bacterium DXS]